MSILEQADIPYLILPGNHDIGTDGYYLFNRFYGREYSYALVKDSFLVVAIPTMYEDDIRAGVFSWANDLIDWYQNKEVIIATHAFIDVDGEFTPDADFGVNLLWDNVVSQHENIVMVLCGHHHGECHVVMPGKYGHPIHVLLSDYQCREEGGRGFMRLLRYYPMSGFMSVTTYSPWLDRYERDRDSQFGFMIPTNSCRSSGM